MHALINVSTPIEDTPRVAQVRGMFDLPRRPHSGLTWEARLRLDDKPWHIGLIAGPSGCGKSTVARRFWPQEIERSRMLAWPENQSVLDGFPEGMAVKDITALLCAVGFSSPPAWLRPFRVLSTGEQFRVLLARLLAEAPRLVVFDEYTSVVDRQSAQFASAAIARAIHRGTLRCRLVAVSCHYDVASWLTPDWVVDTATAQCRRGRLWRPPIELELRRCHRRAWTMFKRHHYLSGSLCETARCYVALWRGEPTVFCAVVPLIGRGGHWRITRLVALPDYQGLGLGLAVAEAVARLYRRDRLRMNITASHPAVVAHCRRSPAWRCVQVRKTGSPRARGFVGNYRGSAGRAVASFEYVGACHD